MNNGWISIHRKLQAHWLWEQNKTFSNLEAWIDILLTVNHTEKKVLLGNKLLIVKRGDSVLSLDSWANRWKWNKSKVRRFFTLLEKDSMIVIKNETQTTRLTVCNYDSYQDMRNANETQVKRKRHASETQVTPNNNVNKENKENNNNNRDEILDDYKKQIATHEHDEWRGHFYRLQGLKPNTASLVIDEFILSHKTLEHKKPKDIRDFKTHLINWCNRQNTLGNNNKILNFKK